MRSDAARWLAIVLIAPMLVLGTFNGAAFLAHWHDDEGLHVHPIGVLDGGKLAAADHADHHAHVDDHGHDHPAQSCDVPADGEPDEDQLATVPHGVIISFDVHKHVPTRSLDLGKILSPPATFQSVAFVLPMSPDLDPHVGSPGGSLNGGPIDLFVLSAGDRLVRTSRALLI